MDKAASARFREEGNAAFRRGRWRDAAAAYTRASEADPGDAVPLANRAQVWIKLERWPEAEADATAALALAPTVKSHYRRALARRAQGNLSGAAADLRSALGKEPNNAVAADELADVEREMRAVAAKEVKEAKAKAGSGTGAPSGGPGAGAAAGAPSGAQARASSAAAGASPASAPTQPQVPAPRTAASPPSAPTAPLAAPAPASKTPASTAGSGGFAGFAALRTTRNARPAYAGARPPATSRGDAPTTQATPVGAISTSTAPQPPRPAVPPVATPSPPPASTTSSPPVPTNPSSTAPGAGLALLRTLRALPSSQRHAYLRHYTPDVVGRIVAPVLEPDGLGMLFAALADGSSGGDAEWTRGMLTALKDTPRYRINCAMLSRAERAAGERASKSVGGEL